MLPSLRLWGCYVDMWAAPGELQRLLTAVPSAWQAAASAVLRSRQPPAPLPVVTPALLVAQRERVCADLGSETRDGQVMKLPRVMVALVIRCQSLVGLAAVSAGLSLKG